MTGDPARRGPLRTLRSLTFRLFYGLPPHLRRRLVRLGAGTYTVGAVVLVTELPAGPGATAGPGPATGGMFGQPDAPAAGRLLMVRQPPGKGWSLPAGLLNRGERPAAGAARELLEETGVRVDAATLRVAVPSAVVHTRGRWIDLVFSTAVSGDTPLAVDGDEILEAGWQSVGALPPVTPATARFLAHYGLGPYRDYPEVIR
ncbi:MAG: NUDIX hydrolase [Dactylosporangium sp.]|nr:NUDIX hydrolase [Dactylosporangium sp.]NNJ62960.1 NUDIX hydrolase [Dactylosporangium sp.]